MAGPNSSPKVNFSDTELAYVAETYGKVFLSPGDVLFDEGSRGECVYIVLDGELEVLKASGGRQVLLNVVGRGEVIGEMAVLQDRPRMASVRARDDVVLIGVSRDQFDEVLSTCPAVTRGILDVVLQREQMTEARLAQATHMANWNALTAGVAHEMNNPAAAIKRGVGQLEEALAEFAHQQTQLALVELSAEQRTAADALLEEIRHMAKHPAQLSALVCSEREWRMEAWLDKRDIADAWKLAPVLAMLDWDVPRLEVISAQYGEGPLPVLLHWTTAAYSAYSLMAEIAGASSQISKTIGVLKGYSYLDQAPVQTVDVNEGLDNTLLILASRIGKGIEVQRDFAPDLPPIQAYGRELNQVWTNILDNALAVLDGQGRIALRTRRDPDGWVAVEIEDNGPGIPAEIQPMLFEPFFTTKKPGQGTGLGLNICYNIVVEKQKGEIKVDSVPGRTVFTVRLPVDFEGQ